MELPDYIPADPDFLKALDAAYKKQRRIYATDLRAVREFAVPEDDEDKALKAVHPEMFDDTVDDEDVEHHTAEEMEFFQQEIEVAWKKFRPQIAAARTAQEQIDRLSDMLRDAFRGTCYTGSSPLMLRFFDHMVNEVSAKYEETQEEVPDAANITRINQTPKQFLTDKLGLMCEYTSMTLDAVLDIENLTEVYEASHGCVGEDAARNPHDVVFKRYCKARNIEDPDKVGMLSEEETPDFVKKQLKFYLDELFAPFNESMPEKVGLEMAWFMGAAVEAIRHEDQEKRENPVLEKFLNPSPVDVAEVGANDNEGPKGFVAAERIRREPREKNERSMIDIMNDPQAMERMHEMLSEIFEDFPDAALTAEGLADAKHAFHCRFLDGEYAVREAESPGR